MFLFTCVTGRCLYIAVDKDNYISDNYNSYKINIGTLYTNIYDRKGRLLNNFKSETIAIAEANEKCLSELEILFDKSSTDEITNELKNGYPVARRVDKKGNTRYIKQFEKIIENPPTMPAKNIISREYGGLEYYISEEIGSLSVNYTINARGELLQGDSVIVNDDNYSSNDGVIISIDRDIQTLAQSAAESIKKGAVVILDTDTSQVLACVSKGDDYINRALSPYAIGSVFKLVVTACALENNMTLHYNCEGKIKIGDTVFHCQNSKVHGAQDIKQALANSCNCYFIRLANELGAQKLYDTAKRLGFGENFSIYNNWTVGGGSVATMDDLSSLGELSLFGFGQGKLTDTPIHLASVIAMIANGGKYNFPTLDITENENKQVIKEENAELIRTFMRYVVSDGTGANADYKGQSAGKTSTAQSGIYIDGKEVLNTFFAGFYPYDNPKFAIVVMCEDGTSGATDCCPVFRTIVEKLDEM